MKGIRVFTYKDFVHVICDSGTICTMASGYPNIDIHNANRIVEKFMEAETCH